jgi:23S rRNA pseudouridine1911/1915/1917 synthase
MVTASTLRSYAELLGVACAVVAVDQSTKALVTDRLQFQTISLLGGAIDLAYTRNTGAAFSVLRNGGVLFAVIAVAVVAGILLYFRRLAAAPVTLRLGLALVLGGALGNLIDRVRLGYVVDFIDLHWWPVFNVADSSIATRGRADRLVIDRREVVAQEDESGKRLDSVLAAQLPDLSRSLIRGLIEDGKVTVNGRPAKPAHRLNTGDRVHVLVELQPSLTAEPEDIPLSVIYRDSDIAVIDKPAGLVVHPAPGHERGTLANALMAAFPNAAGVAPSERPGIVHRLDRDTSGLIAVALSPRGQASLRRQIASREALRQYVALVQGTPHPDRGIIDAPIGRDRNDRKRMAAHGVAARAARTEYRVLERLDGLALIEATLQTGRTHQIRVHLAAIGHPVAGDVTYHGPRLAGLDRQFLHAARLQIRVPESGDVISLESPLPGDLSAVLDRLRGEFRHTWNQDSTT